MPKEMTWHDDEIQNSLVFGERKNPVALCVLWNFMDRIVPSLSELGHNPFGVIANMRTWNGIGWVLRGLWQLNFINKVVVWGSDNLLTGEAFIQIMREGVGDDFSVKGIGKFLNPQFIDLESLNVLRGLVEVEDKRGCNLSKVASSYSLRPKLEAPNREKRDFPPMAVPDTVILPSQGLSFHAHASDVFSAWLQVVNFVVRCGTIRRTRKKEDIVHLFNVAATFPVPEAEIIHLGFGVSREDLDRYYSLNFKRVADLAHLESNEYLYSDRISRWDGNREKLKDMSWEGYNQLLKCVERLNKSPETKRASAVLLGPTDLEELEDAPCFVLFTLALQGGQLVGSYVFRSHDILKGWPSNLLAISRMHRETALSLGVKPGFVSVCSHNAQVYSRDLSEAMEVLDKYFYNLKRRREFMVFKQDPAGNFVFLLDKRKKEVTARLVGEEGPLTEFSDSDPEVLINFLAVSFPWLTPSHLIYLGKEMEKLSRAMAEPDYQYAQG